MLEQELVGISKMLVPSAERNIRSAGRTIRTTQAGAATVIVIMPDLTQHEICTVALNPDPGKEARISILAKTFVCDPPTVEEELEL